MVILNIVRGGAVLNNSSVTFTWEYDKYDSICLG